jgi:hypothetical protein
MCCPDPLWGALRTNTSLKVLRFHGPANYKDDLVDVLANHNSTIQQVVHLADERLDYYCQLNRAGRALVRDLANHNSTIQQVVHLADERLDYYCQLNRAGRALVRDPRTTKEEFVKLLLQRVGQAEILYGLLLDVPALWSM